MISPEFIGHTFAVHNGNKFIPVFVSENMVVIIGEFSPTRTFRMHSGDRKNMEAVAISNLYANLPERSGSP